MNVFRKIFKKFKPPLAISLPKKEQCFVYNEAERTKTTKSNENYKKHRKRKENIANMKNKDKNDVEISKTMIYASFDLQTVLTLPYASDAQIYFSRKLSIMNLTVYDSRKKGICYLWDETRRKKKVWKLKPVY